MRKFVESLFDSKAKIVLRTLELMVVLLSLVLILYHKVNPVSISLEADDFAVTTIGDNENTLCASNIALKPGVYKVWFSFLCTEPGSFVSAHSDKLYGVNLKTGKCELPTTSTGAYITMDLRGRADDIKLIATPSGSGIFEIYEATIVRTLNSELRHFVEALFFIFLMEMCILLSGKDREYRRTAIILTLVSLVVSIPVFTDYVGGAHDILFHLARIEGLAEGLRSGSFPVKIQPLWGNDYGYAVGVFYGDLLLYIPAVLRLLGFSLQTAYKLYVVMINFATVFVSYFSFRTMFRRKDTAMVCASLYAFSVYRLTDTYTRAAIGEYTAMMFLPVIVCGFYMILSVNERPTRLNSFKGELVTSLGLTGLITCHMLSCEMISVFIILALLICIKRVIRPYTFLSLLKALGMTVLMSLGFIIPFLDFMGQPLNVTSAAWKGASTTGIQEYGISPVQLLSMFGKAAGGSYTTATGIHDEVSYSVGFVFVLILMIYLLMLPTEWSGLKTRSKFGISLVMTGFGLISLIVSTEFFPWNRISSMGGFLYKAISLIQFPWRFVGFATVFLTFTAGFLYEYLKDKLSEIKFTSLLTILTVIMAVNSMYFISDYSLNTEPYRVYDTYEVISGAFYSAEYLREGTDINKFVPNKVTASDNVSFDGYVKNGTNISVNVASDSNGGFIELPLNFYKYYESNAAGLKLTTVPGVNNCVKVLIPENFNGKLETAFKEPFYWRISEALSLIGFITFIYIWIRMSKSDEKNKQ